MATYLLITFMPFVMRGPYRLDWVSSCEFPFSWTGRIAGVWDGNTPKLRRPVTLTMEFAMNYSLLRRLLVTILMSLLLKTATTSAAVEVRVGNHPSCDHASLRDAIGQPDLNLDLRILVQGRAKEGADGQQGVHDADLTIIGPRTIEIVGDDGSSPHSTCTGFNAARRPEIHGLGSSDVGYKVVVQEGGTLILENINVKDTTAGGIQLSSSSLSADNVDFVGNSTPTNVSGAAIQADSSMISLRNSEFLGNFSPAAGGAIFCTASELGNMTMQNVSFGTSRTGSGNRASFDGGAIALHRNCVLEILGGVAFEGNFAGRDGGAVSTAANEVNRIDLRADIKFGQTQGNLAVRNGGAVALGPKGHLFAEDTLSVFSRNFAGEAGGAIHVARDARALLLGCERFVQNKAGSGGAIHAEGIVTVRNLERTPLCEPSLELPSNEYQTMFDSNLATAKGGGAIFATGEGALVRIEQAVLVGNDSTLSGTTLPPFGSVAFVEEGAKLHIENSLLYDNGHESTVILQDPPTLLHADDSGSRIDIGLTTVAENIGSVPLIVTGGAASRLFGVIEHDNDMFSPTVGGDDILSVCSTIDHDLDPRFIPPPGTKRGLFRLASDSPMRGFCRAADAPFAVRFERDLDDIGRSQLLVGDQIHIDAGAFNHNFPLSVLSECATQNGRDGLALSMSGDGESFNVTGNGPNLPVTTNTGAAFIDGDGSGFWTDLLVSENHGDLEQLRLGTVSCSGPVMEVQVSGPGRVASNPEGIDCPEGCTALFPASESVFITATPDHGAVFEGWSEQGCGNEPVCELTMQDDLTLEARFSVTGSIFADKFVQ